MNNKTDFSMNVPVSPDSSGFKPLPDRVAFDLCNVYPVPGGNLLLRNRRTGKQAVVMPEVHATLASCDQFRTLDEHVARLIANNPEMQGQQANIRQVLQSMLDNGIMVSARTFCDDLKRKVEPSETDANADKPVVVILTWERPTALERLLQSIKTNCATDKFHQLYVVDDSRDADNIRQNRELTAKYSFAMKAPVQYFGQTEQQSLLNSLCQQLPAQEDAIRFLADQSRWRDHWTSGLARNLALLLSCGRRLVMLDDDTICDVFEPGQLRPDISISDSPREADFFSSEQEWIPQHQPINPDPIDRHMRCLGLPLSAALGVFGASNLKPPGLNNAHVMLMNELGPTSPVLVTECGSLGCPGIGKNTWLPDMAPDSIKRMLSSPQKTTNALSTRMVWTGRVQPHFSPRPNMSQITGFDNREMLPPYMPIMRREDRLFGYLLDFIFPAALSLDYPWAVPHLPIPLKQWRDEDRDFTPGPSFPVLFYEQLVARKFDCKAEQPADRLAAVSAWFKDLAAAPTETLLTDHQDATLRDTTEQLRNLTSLLEAGQSAPDEWQTYLKQGIEQLGAGFETASGKDFPVSGLPAGLKEEELISFWKQTWSGFAAALTAWPEIRQAAEGILNNQRASDSS